MGWDGMGLDGSGLNAHAIKMFLRLPLSNDSLRAMTPFYALFKSQ